jgi:hypothetical protein
MCRFRKRDAYLAERFADTQGSDADRIAKFPSVSANSE